MEKYVAFQVKDLWDKYQFDKKIDSGAFGSVIKVKNTEDQKLYAMKIQNLKNLMTHTADNYSKEMLRIIREINTFKLTHQNITKFVESYFTQDDQFVIVTELAESNLCTYRENNELTNAQIADIMIQIVKGTIHLHDQNIMHRDLSPDNILVFENGKKFKICDFGLSQMLNESYTVVGKQNFIAPEIVFGEEFGYSNQVDIWSLGIILYYLCTKQYQYQGKNISDLKKQDKTIRIRLQGQQKIFQQLLNKMLKFDSTKRLNSFQVLSELCKINKEPLNKHLEIEEEKQKECQQSYTNDDGQNTFNLTFKQAKTVVNEINAQLVESCFGPIDKAHSFQMPILWDTDGNRYQGNHDNKKKLKDGRGRFRYNFNNLSLKNHKKVGQERFNFDNGQERYNLDNGDYYIGEWKDDKFNGYGKYYWIDGTIYEGEWVNFKQEGLGLIKQFNGNQYYGSWVDGQKQGVGVYTYKNGDIELGQWMNNQQHGIQFYILKDGGLIQIRNYEYDDLKETLLEIVKPQKQLQLFESEIFNE
ncbi:protein kinase domain containing protein [Stylonychia lemnae]|uniref:Protein kinase domain containing protein n=1 Tax=Stylonychia lemnae TaxID=5949 RepID=A0A078B5F8_STYLE|nr:protein kinase domain containing protein [Stylonychia lemnae]|eukprot:CDW89426.1 protein kinase domain containing protein [Stylonychia lemnae]